MIFRLNKTIVTGKVVPEVQRFLNHVLELQFAPVFKNQLKPLYIKGSTECTAKWPGLNGRSKRDRFGLPQLPVLKDICQLLKVSECGALLFDLAVLNRSSQLY